MSSSPTKDAEKGPAVIADEVELARMGYKQELKFVHLSVRQCRVLTFIVFLADESSVSCRYKSFGFLQEFVFHGLFFRTSVFRSPSSAS